LGEVRKLLSAYEADWSVRRRIPVLSARRHIVMLVVLAALFVPAKAQAGGGAYVFSGGSEAARAQVRAALEASSFDWSLVSATVTFRIANCGCAGSSPGLIVLDETQLAAAPYGRAYTWAIVQHEYAHQVWDFALDDAARALSGRGFAASTSATSSRASLTMRMPASALRTRSRGRTGPIRRIRPVGAGQWAAGASGSSWLSSSVNEHGWNSLAPREDGMTALEAVSERG
jgi:hypothetical protein